LDFELNFEEDNLETLKSKMEDLFDPESETYS